MNDKALIRRIREGKTEYAGETARRYYDDVFRFVCFQTGDRELAGDLTQETFLRFIRYADSLTDNNVKGYLLTVAANLCRDYWRNLARNGQTQPMDDYMELAALEADGPEAGMALKDALLLLPECQREAIVLHYYYNYKYREIARMTGAVTATVKSRIRQGCLKLREMLRKEDFYG